MAIRIGNTVYIHGLPPITVEPDNGWQPSFEGIDLRAISLKPGAVLMLRLMDESDEVGLTSSSPQAQ